ncbi:unnamed protein product [Heligmosomoides polygyrus]|uniref:VWFA domain-containing protein n=1 Tax=Heligmosomoides polygyrus TaxID=6339 RepID=A0A183FW85_HELPZ|nr:unnamed protein product [Heligmosomoides polygyrus]
MPKEQKKPPDKVAEYFTCPGGAEILRDFYTAPQQCSHDGPQAVQESKNNSRRQVNYIFASTATCGSAPPDASLTPMVTTAYNSGGNVAFVESANVKSYLSAFLPTLYSTSVLTNPTFHSRFTCAGNTDWYVEVDRNTSSIFVSTTSQYGSLGVINPLNQNMAAMVLFNSGQTKLYEIVSDGLPGIYTLTVFTEFAFTSADDPLGSHNDGMVPHPSVGVSNIATFHLYGRPGQEGILQYVEVYSPDTGDLVMRSELYPRGLCAFEYYSDSFTCGTESLEFMVYGMDEYNQQFRRLEQFFCYNHSHTAVTTVPPPVTLTGPVGPTTQPGTVSTGPLPVVTTTPQAVMSSSPKDHLTTAVAAMYQFDVVFLIDVSQEASGRLDDMNNFVASVMSGYDVSQQNARVALIVVGSTTLGSITAANLDTIDSQSNLLKYLMVVSQFTDYDNAGQAIAAGLNIAVNNQFMLSGYRNQLKNHVLIYVTATTKFDDQPQPIATKILQAGSYGIITVGYGPLVTDLNALQWKVLCLMYSSTRCYLGAFKECRVMMIHIATDLGFGRGSIVGYRIV